MDDDASIRHIPAHLLEWRWTATEPPGWAEQNRARLVALYEIARSIEAACPEHAASAGFITVTDGCEIEIRPPGRRPMFITLMPPPEYDSNPRHCQERFGMVRWQPLGGDPMRGTAWDAICAAIGHITGHPISVAMNDSPD